MKLIGRGLLGLLLSSLAYTAPAFAIDGWSLNQTAKGGAALSGGMTLYITANGMRTFDPKNGVSLMTRGPNWTVYIFNDKTKRMFQSPFQPWLASFKQRNLVGRFEGATWRRGSANGSVSGVRAYEFVMDKPPVVQTNSKSISGKIKQYGSIQAASLWVASDIATPPEVSNILCKIYGVPDCQRIPLRVVVTERGKAPATAVDTVKISHINVQDSLFAVPSNYQVVKTDTDVFIDKESMDTLDEMLQDIDAPSTPRRRPGVQNIQQRPGQRR